MEQRKNEHIELASSSRVSDIYTYYRFSYEPVLGSHAHGEIEPFTFLGRTMRTPIWVSSMTGGGRLAREINTNLAQACNESGMGIVAAVGMACNFATVRSLVTIGIQQGHMRLHLSNLLNLYEANPFQREKALVFFRNRKVSHSALKQFLLLKSNEIPS